MSHHLLNDNEPTACFVLFPPFTHTPTLFFPVALTVNNGKQCVTIQLIIQLIGTKAQCKKNGYTCDLSLFLISLIINIVINVPLNQNVIGKGYRKTGNTVSIIPALAHSMSTEPT